MLDDRWETQKKNSLCSILPYLTNVTCQGQSIESNQVFNGHQPSLNNLHDLSSVVVSVYCKVEVKSLVFIRSFFAPILYFLRSLSTLMVASKAICTAVQCAGISHSCKALNFPLHLFCSLYPGITKLLRHVIYGNIYSMLELHF